MWQTVVVMQRGSEAAVPAQQDVIGKQLEGDGWVVADGVGGLNWEVFRRC